MSFDYWEWKLDKLAADKEAREQAANDARERTLGGTVIEAGRNVFDPKENLSLPEQVKRARQNDGYAEISADTVAMLPRVKVLTAGAVRTVILADPHASFSENAISATFNFTEGMALNGLGKLGSRGTAPRPGDVRSRALAHGLTHFGVGFGIGSVKAGFNENTWLNPQTGQVDFVNGVFQVTKAGTTGGVINVPAGFIGQAFTHHSMRQAEAGLWSHRTASVVSGMGGGYAGGAVFGAVDAKMRGGGIKEILEGAKEGGLIGMGTGAFTGAFVPMEPMPSFSKRMLDADATAKSEPTRDSKAGRTTRVTDLDDGLLPNAERNRVNRRRQERWNERPDGVESPRHKVETYDKLNIKSEPESTLEVRRAELGKYGHTVETFTELKPNAEKILEGQTVFDAQLHRKFLTEGTVEVPKKCREYDIDKVSLVYEEGYAARLDQVFELRIKADKYVEGADNPPDVVAAKADLEAHPLRDAAHPVDMVAMIRGVPNKELPNRIIVSEHEHATQVWDKLSYNSKHVTGATADDFGNITFFAPKRTDLNRDLLNHEWAHLLKGKTPHESKLYELAAFLEKDGHQVSEYATREYPEHPEWKYEESFAEQMKYMLHMDADVFIETVHQTPLRAVAAARAWERSMAVAVPGDRGTYHSIHQERIKYIKENVLPEAQEILVGLVKTGSPEQKAKAAQMLATFGNESHIAVLRKQALKESPARKDIFEAGLEAVAAGKRQFVDYDRDTTVVETKDAQIDYLVSMAQSGSRSRDDALQHLGGMLGRRANAYYDLLTLPDLKFGQAQKALRLLTEMPDASGKEQVWAEALRIAGDNPNKRVDLAIATLNREPHLTEQALAVLSTHPGERTTLALSRFATGEARTAGGQRTQMKARDALVEALATERFAKLSSQVEKGSEFMSIHAMKELAQTKDMRAVPVLIYAYAKGTTAQKAAASAALSEHYPANLTLQVARGMMERNPALREPLQPLLRRS